MWLFSVLFFRSQTVQQRKRYVALVDSVRENGGEVKIFSSLHVSGERRSIYSAWILCECDLHVLGKSRFLHVHVCVQAFSISFRRASLPSVLKYSRWHHFDYHNLARSRKISRLPPNPLSRYCLELHTPGNLLICQSCAWLKFS